MDLAARQAGGAQRIDVDDVVVGVDDLVNARAYLPQLVVLQPQTENGLLEGYSEVVLKTWSKIGRAHV